MPPATSNLHQPARVRARERGFTVVEILVVMLIVAVLMAVVAPRFMGAKGTTYAKEAKAAGAAYAQAIAQYQGDNYNKHPALPAKGAKLQRGPLNLMGKPYLPEVPEAVQGNRVGVDAAGMGTGNCTNAPTVTKAGNRFGQVTICLAAAPNYAVRVATRADASSTDWDICWYGRTGKQPSC